MSLSLVWFKRDLRVEDHAALNAAAARGAVIALYVIEPSLWARPEYSVRQYAFLTECLAGLDAALTALGISLVVRTGEVTEVLAAIHAEHAFTHIEAHEETGLIATWQRDRAVAAWARDHGIVFTEHAQHGVRRPHRSRNGWAAHWGQFMALPLYNTPEQLYGPSLPREAPPPPERLGLAPDPCPLRQSGGKTIAGTDLKSFLYERGAEYRRAMSSPLTAFDACSRISAHLALGTLSMRESYQAALAARARHRDRGDTGYARSIDSFIARLHWHCHFIQKFEDQTAIEHAELHPAWRGARPEATPETLQRWINGETGFPFLDACMRALNATGWLNFRMRAMAAAFSSYHLWQDWRAPAAALAARFTDFEPGIHYPQFQMQSGTTGINTPRIYNPVKQSFDQDAEGAFIRRWVPELAHLPTPFLHEPWKAGPTVLKAAGIVLGETYPDRIVDHEAAAREARARMTAIRKSAGYRDEARAINIRHGSRKSGLKQTGRPRKPSAGNDPRQAAFDFSEGGR